MAAIMSLITRHNRPHNRLDSDCLLCSVGLCQIMSESIGVRIIITVHNRRHNRISASGVAYTIIPTIMVLITVLIIVFIIVYSDSH